MASEPLSKRIKPVTFKRKTYQNEGSHIYSPDIFLERGFATSKSVIQE